MHRPVEVAFKSGKKRANLSEITDLNLSRPCRSYVQVIEPLLNTTSLDDDDGCREKQSPMRGPSFPNKPCRGLYRLHHGQSFPPPVSRDKSTLVLLVRGAFCTSGLVCHMARYSNVGPASPVSHQRPSRSVTPEPITIPVTDQEPNRLYL